MHVQKPNAESHNKLPFPLFLHVQTPYAVDWQNEEIEVTQEAPNSSHVRQHVLGTAVSWNRRVVRALDRFTKEDRLEPGDDIEDKVGSHGAASEPFNSGANGEDAVEEEQEG